MGENVFKDQKEVLERYGNKPFYVLGVTDTTTTDSMGVMGSHMLDEGINHGYCTVHNLHRNALLAFDGTLISHVCFFVVRLQTFLNN